MDGGGNDEVGTMMRRSPVGSGTVDGLGWKEDVRTGVEGRAYVDGFDRGMKR